MRSLVFLLIVAAASAASIADVKDDKIVYKCVLLSADKGLILKDIKMPLYACETADGDKIVMAGKDLLDEKLDAVVDKETYLKLKDLVTVSRPKRQFGLGGFGGGGSNANAQASSGSFGGGFGGPGGLGFGGGGSYSNAGASSNSFGLGGGSPFYG